ncbi:MAG: NAD(P)H-hydrate dehydratase, partial [Bdellovibrionaceae bacterium]|nr:NAD(P)H-hydrate dehydratase [Pseudobdellovibrionaceae bacterium]
VTFGLAKPGFFIADGPIYVGRLRVLPIGFPHEALRSLATTHFCFNEKLARRYLPKRGVRSNKSDHGRVVVVAGREGMWGAGLLCASSAYRVGAGYVTWASFEVPSEHLIEAPEILTSHVDDPELWKSSDLAVAVGPGLGVTEETAKLIESLKEKDFPVVLDADAISACVKFDLFPLPSHWILTPHTGELSRIIGKSIGEIESDRYLAALLGSERTGCHLLLKGYRSVLAYQHRAMVINSGNSALAKAGTGDVLTGMIAGLLAQKVEPIQATATASYIHGRMADEWVRSGHDRRSLNASDLRNHLPTLMSRLATGAIV